VFAVRIGLEPNSECGNEFESCRSDLKGPSVLSAEYRDAELLEETRGGNFITYVIRTRPTMLNLMPEVIIGLVLAAYVGYYGLVVIVETRAGRKLE
jgi:hypothetical protein